MSRRTERINNLIRNVIGELLLAKMSDPRIDPARVSITRVEASEDLTSAKVFVSVIGTEAQQRNTLRALRHAAGRLQDLMMRQIELRYTPVLDFILDVNFKKTLKTLQLIQQAMAEIDRKKQAEKGGATPQADAEEDPE